MIFLTSCIDTFNREIISTQTIQVHDFEVEETIYHTANWPDHRYERIYRASYVGDQSIYLGDFENESQTGIVFKPVVVDDRLVLFSSATVFLWRPGEEPIHFNPFVAEGWYEYSQEKQLNGHYDYLAKNVSMHGQEWLLSYECDRCKANKPQEVLFVSEDGGQTFEVCLNPTNSYSTCSD